MRWQSSDAVQVELEDKPFEEPAGKAEDTWLAVAEALRGTDRDDLAATSPLEAAAKKLA